MQLAIRWAAALCVTAAAIISLAADPSTKPAQPATNPTTQPAIDNWFPGMLHPPHVTLKLPADFTLVSASPGDEWNMYDGVIWAPTRSAAIYAHLKEKKFEKLQDPLIFVHLSSDVAQMEGTDNFTVEKDLDAMVKATGVRKSATDKHRWGKYPVLEWTGERPNGHPIYAAWVGINSPDGWTIFIDYRVPAGEGHPTEAERAVWTNLMKDTTGTK
jgi:hypothetical protein